MSELEECLPEKFMSLTWIAVPPLMHPLVYTFFMCRSPQKCLSRLLPFLQSNGNGVPSRKWWELLEEGTVWKFGRGREVLDIKAGQNGLGLHQLFCCGRRMTLLWGHVRVLAKSFVVLWKRSWSRFWFGVAVGFIPFFAVNRTSLAGGLTRTLVKGTGKGGVPFARFSMQKHS